MKAIETEGHKEGIIIMLQTRIYPVTGFHVDVQESYDEETAKYIADIAEQMVKIRHSAIGGKQSNGYTFWTTNARKMRRMQSQL